MQQLLIAPKDFKIIGRLLAYENPALANHLYSSYQSNQKTPAETDLSKIEPFFLQFCKEESILPSEHRGAQYKRIRIDKQRLFIAVIIQIYAPNLFDPKNRNQRVPNGLRKSIAISLHKDQDNTSRLIQEIIMMERVYDEFRGRAEKLVTVLIKA